MKLYSEIVIDLNDNNAVEKQEGRYTAAQIQGCFLFPVLFNLEGNLPFYLTVFRSDLSLLTVATSFHTGDLLPVLTSVQLQTVELHYHECSPVSLGRYYNTQYVKEFIKSRTWKT